MKGKGDGGQRENAHPAPLSHSLIRSFSSVHRRINSNQSHSQSDLTNRCSVCDCATDKKRVTHPGTVQRPASGHYLPNQHSQCRQTTEQQRQRTGRQGILIGSDALSMKLCSSGTAETIVWHPQQPSKNLSCVLLEARRRIDR